MSSLFSPSSSPAPLRPQPVRDRFASPALPARPAKSESLAQRVATDLRALLRPKVLELQHRFTNALVKLRPNAQQMLTLQQLEKALEARAQNLSAEQMNFSLTRAQDDEICLNRRTQAGVSTVLVHEDGSVAFSFISLPGSPQPDVLEFALSPSADEAANIVDRFVS